MNAETAKEWGLVSEIVPAENLMAEATALAERICVQPPQALRMTKSLMREGMSASFDNIMEMSAGLQAIMQNTEDHLEAVNAFFDKRTPNFTGK